MKSLVYKLSTAVLTVLILFGAASDLSAQDEKSWKEEFKKEIKELKEEVKELKAELKKKKFHFRFNEDEFNVNLEDLDEHINEAMAHVNKNLKVALLGLDKKIDIDIDFNDNILEKFSERMEKMSEKIEAKVKVIGEYIDELKTELVKDGYIEDEDDLDKLDQDDDGNYEVNGKLLKPEHQQKYKDMHKKYFGDEDLDWDLGSSRRFDCDDEEEHD